MTDQDYTQPPADAGWEPLQNGGLIELVGPIYAKRDGLEPGEPLRLGFRVAPKHANGAGNCHGGMLATFLDQVLGMSVRTALGAGGPTMTLTVDYLSAGLLGDWIESRSRLVHSTYRTGYVDAIIYGSKGPVARANGLWRVNRPKED